MIPIDQLNAQLSSVSAKWVAKQTPQSLLSEIERVHLLGVVVNEAALSAAMARKAEVSDANFAPAVDWRNRNGNHVTEVKDQGGCGSCVSFCTVATVESMASIEKAKQLNLSEADLHFCSTHGPNCGGWWPDDAYNVFKSRGVSDEACFPYSSAFDGSGKPSCKSCSDRDARAVKITQSTTLVSAVDRKNWLTNVGPCCAVLYVYTDFYSYGSGVYHHVSGKVEGLHCVEVIGYSEAEQCWICKNSWGKGWGDQGFFKIGYGEAGIDNEFVTNDANNSKFPFWTVQGVILPNTPVEDFYTATPAVAAWGLNRLDCFVRSTDSNMWHKWWNGSQWSNWEDLGGTLTSAPAVAAWGLNRLDCFVRGTDNHMWHKWWNGSQWSNWEDLGGTLTSAPAVAAWGLNRLDCFVRGTDNHMWHKWWDGSKWSNWEDLGGTITSSPAVAAWGPNRLDCFARGTDNHMWHKWWNGSQWSNWEDLGGIITSSPAVAAWGANRLDCFARGTDNHMWHKWWDGSKWSNWEDLGGIITSAPAVAAWGANRLDCFARGTDNHMWHKWWDGSKWSNWEDLGGTLA
jgi:C1A family cysteine protease